MPFNIVEIKGLYKSYKKEEQLVLNDMNLSLLDGEIHGVLGPNGAGKTTTIGIMVGLIDADKGAVIIDGHSVFKEMDLVKKSIGLVPQEIALYPSLSAHENLDYFASIYGLTKKERSLLIKKYLKRVGLFERRNDPISTYSGGMKRRINLIVGILHNPKLLILDEPTVGIDVQSKNVILEIIEELNTSGVSVLYTSHLMEEAERICHRISIMDCGKIIAQGSPKELLSTYPDCNNLEDVYMSLTGKSLRD